MRERALLIGARLEVTGAGECGTRVRLTLAERTGE
jgi:nitrate/nitrite-specific signal transduction histidine kinase